MKTSDALWIQKISKKLLDKPTEIISQQNLAIREYQFFMEETLALLKDYTAYLTGVVWAQNPSIVYKLFPIQQPRLSAMFIRGRDKLVIGSDGRHIFVRATQGWIRLMLLPACGLRLNYSQKMCWGDFCLGAFKV